MTNDDEACSSNNADTSTHKIIDEKSQQEAKKILEKELIKTSTFDDLQKFINSAEKVKSIKDVPTREESEYPDIMFYEQNTFLFSDVIQPAERTVIYCLYRILLYGEMIQYILLGEQFLRARQMIVDAVEANMPDVEKIIVKFTILVNEEWSRFKQTAQISEKDIGVSGPPSQLKLDEIIAHLGGDLFMYKIDKPIVVPDYKEIYNQCRVWCNKITTVMIDNNLCFTYEFARQIDALKDWLLLRDKLSLEHYYIVTENMFERVSLESEGWSPIPIIDSNVCIDYFNPQSCLADVAILEDKFPDKINVRGMVKHKIYGNGNLCATNNFGYKTFGKTVRYDSAYEYDSSNTNNNDVMRIGCYNIRRIVELMHNEGPDFTKFLLEDTKTSNTIRNFMPFNFNAGFVRRASTIEKEPDNKGMYCMMNILIPVIDKDTGDIFDCIAGCANIKKIFNDHWELMNYSICGNINEVS